MSRVVHTAIGLGLMAFHSSATAPAVAELIRFKNITNASDFSRFPCFYTSDADYDAFMNEWFIHYLSVGERGVYYGSPLCLGKVNRMWVIYRDAWMLCTIRVILSVAYFRARIQVDWDWAVSFC
ncbi:MAG: hypothetical protein ACUVRS_00060 [Armatimonadota bacterium]